MRHHTEKTYLQDHADKVSADESETAKMQKKDSLALTESNRSIHRRLNKLDSPRHEDI